MENRPKEIENSKNDFSRMFLVIKENQQQKPKIPLLIKTETEGFAINKKEQAKNTQVLNSPFTANSNEPAIHRGRNKKHNKITAK